MNAGISIERMASSMSKFDSEVRAPSIAFKEAKRYTPDHEYMFKMVFQALAIGFAVWIALLFMCPLIDEMMPRHAAAGAGASVLIILIINYVMQWRNELLWMTEEIMGHDIDGDGYQGQPPPVHEFNYRQSERTAWRARLPAPEPVIRDWARAALTGGDSLSYAAWQKRFSTRPNYGDGVERYRKFRQALVQAGWALEQGTHSITLTERGEEALEEWLVQNPDPVPLLEE